MKWLALLIVFPFFSDSPGSKGNISFLKGKDSLGDRFAVVELFTSEGCSSCPAAEQVLTRLADQYLQNVYFLEFHVDYWNRLGWKDPFSKSAYSNRQRWYSKAPGGDGVYTPQSIINGITHLVGSNESAIRKTIEKSLNTPCQLGITLSATLKHQNKIAIKFLRDLTVAPDIVNIALVEIKAQTIVKGGENKGKTLLHRQIVREFVSSKQPSGTMIISLPANEPPDHFMLIAFIQDKDSYVIKAAASAVIVSP